MDTSEDEEEGETVEKRNDWYTSDSAIDIYILTRLEKCVVKKGEKFLASQTRMHNAQCLMDSC